MRNVLFIAGLIALGVSPARAQSPPITVQQAWSRATPPGAQAAVIYMTILDHGTPDRLLALSTPVAGMAQMHQTVTEHQIATMRPVASLPITAASPVVFAPNGTHVMLTDLKQSLVAGQSFPLTLTFQHAGQVRAMVTVQPLGAAGPPAEMAPMPGMDMSMPMPASR